MNKCIECGRKIVAGRKYCYEHRYLGKVRKRKTDLSYFILLIFNLLWISILSLVFLVEFILKIIIRLIFRLITKKKIPIFKENEFEINLRNKINQALISERFLDSKK